MATDYLTVADVLGMHTALDDGYQAMAADAAREDQAQEWCKALAEDLGNEAR